MTDGETQPARPGRLRTAWRGFQHWRRTRPFWGGLLTALAGVEIFGTAQVSLAGLAFQTGPTGFLSWLIPAILVTCGLLMWFTPQHRVFYAVVAAVTALFSLIGVNLGGFFIGLILGIVGSALGYAWALAPDPAAGRAEPDDDRTTRGPAGEGAGRDASSGDPQDESPDEAGTRHKPATGTAPDLPAPGAGPAPSGSSRPSSTS